ncbi:hypothetical protein H696_05965 [Fonticula alba]|uniref:GPI mannosyltransferase 1 n=1 Tax=Fonticula alba TaxID=691883 RepID=A0A058Z231_FONAL|nr:hypothetical protein H696_05965 [Fonticula alba]KCV67567.1 hypothetical protein H696_05965 [Fonticula alba]|eukprot:XP_009498008.1 hypothetical protein H696_05965 [Fonticula alba]
MSGREPAARRARNVSPLLWVAQALDQRRWLLPVIGLVLRLGLVAYGEWQDRTMAVRFTDIDYHVFTDAAQFVAAGESPYQRLTYRYTPLLAWLLLVNPLTGSFLPGKVLFSLVDLAAGVLLGRLLLARRSALVGPNAAKTRADRELLLEYLCNCLWMVNPFTMTITARGNSEAITALLLVGCLYLLARRRVALAAMVFGLLVHFRTYPIIYAIPLALSIEVAGPVVSASGGRLARAIRFCLARERLLFAAISAGTFLALTGFFYRLYGYQFLHDSLLYHLTRRDHRHNFSLYYYFLYQTIGNVASSSVYGLLAFVPQLVALGTIVAAFHQDIVFCLFLQTVVFVAFNKVITSQYFMWYLTLLPLVLPFAAGLRRRPLAVGLPVLGFWLASQGVWLAAAYELEFLGQPTFERLWIGGALLFAAHVALVVVMILGQAPAPGLAAAMEASERAAIDKRD